MQLHLSDQSLRRWSWASLGCLVTAGAVSAVFEFFDDTTYEDWGSSQTWAEVGFVLVIALFPVVGLLITRRHPRNRIGWLCHLIGIAWAVTAAADSYIRWALLIRPGSLPGGEALETVNGALWAPPIILMGVFLPLLFPTGRVPGPRWRWVPWVAAVDMAVIVVGISLSPGPVDDVLVPLDENPLGVPALEGPLQVVAGIALSLLPLLFLVSATGVIVRFRRAHGVERLQLKWLMTAGAVIAVIFAAAMFLSISGLGHADGEDPPVLSLLQNLSTLGFGLIPVAIGIAISRHGLYEIDTLISRTLLVALLGAFVTFVYVGIVVGVGALIGQQHASVWLSVLATALVAVGFQPVRERGQRLVNRLVYGSRATPYEVLSDFSERMAGQYTTAELLPRVSQTLSECLGGAQVDIWLRSGNQVSREACWPLRDQPEVAREAATDADVLAAVMADRVVPVRHRDELLGLLSVSKKPGEQITPGEDEVLAHVASQTGLVLRNVRLVEDLQASRQRLVTTADDQRRRLERDLHDGAQQNLVAVALMLRMAADQPDRDALAGSVRQAADQLQRAIAELRELARGIHPAILTDRGLSPALTSLAERCPVPVRVDSTLARRLPGPVEGSLYFVVAESLTNVAKYAGATLVTVTLRDNGDRVLLEVHDDGGGGADPGLGSGLLGLSDRVAVVDGTFRLRSPVGEGTTISCEIPVAPAVPAAAPDAARVAEPAL